MHLVLCAALTAFGVAHQGASLLPRWTAAVAPAYSRTAKFVAQAPGEATDEYEVEVARPLGIQLTQKDGVGPVVSLVLEGSNAAISGVAAGDVIVATSASVGRGMWPKNTVVGVESAIQTRVDGQVRLRLRRPSTGQRKPSWEGELTHEFEVELRQPLGLVLRQRQPSSTVPTAPGTPGVEIVDVSDGGSARASGLIRPGDLVVATSGTVGDNLWEKSNLEGVLSSISTRLALSPSVRLRLQRQCSLGPWASELSQISRGERTAVLSSAARASLLGQRRDLARGILKGDALFDALRDLAVELIVRTGRRGQGWPPRRYGEGVLLERLRRRLRGCRIPLDTRVCTAGMSAALRVSEPELALAFFEQLHADGGKADATVYTTLIKAHAAAGRVSEALAVEQRMNAEGVPLTVLTYNTLMAVCARAGDRSGMLAYFEAITERGLRPTVGSWNIVLNFCAKLPATRCLVQTEGVLRRMRDRGIAPDAVSYTSHAEACIKSDDFAGLEAIIETIETEGVVPDTVLLNTVLSGLAKSRMWRPAYALLTAWTDKGVAADSSSYAHALRACVNARVPSHATQVVRRMREGGLTPDVRIYSMLLSSYAKSGKVRASLNLLKEMRTEGIRPTAHIYAGLMEACLVAERPRTAIELFEQMEAQAIPRDTVLYTLLVRATVAPGGLPTANGTSSVTDAGGKMSAKVRRESSRRGKSPVANSSAAPHAAMAILKTMVAAGGNSAPNTITYNEVLVGCLAHGAVETALEVLEEMTEANLVPNRRTSQIIASIAQPGGSTPTDAPPRDRTRSAARSGAGLSHGRTSPGRIPPATTLAFLRRVIALFGKRRLRLGGDVYLTAMEAARRLDDVAAARELMAARLERRTFHMRRVHEVQAEAEEERLLAGQWGAQPLAQEARAGRQQP